MIGGFYHRRSRDDIVGRIRDFERRFGGETRGGHDQGKALYSELIAENYDLATDLFEYGWGRSFQFAGRRQGESFADALARSQRCATLPANCASNRA